MPTIHDLLHDMNGCVERSSNNPTVCRTLRPVEALGGCPGSSPIIKNCLSRHSFHHQEKNMAFLKVSGIHRSLSEHGRYVCVGSPGDQFPATLTDSLIRDLPFSLPQLILLALVHSYLPRRGWLYLYNISQSWALGATETAWDAQTCLRKHFQVTITYFPLRMAEHSPAHRKWGMNSLFCSICVCSFFFTY